MTTSHNQSASIKDCSHEFMFRALLDQMQDAVFIYDLDGNYQVVNQRAAEMTGYTVDELMTMHALQLIAPDAHENYRQILQRLLAGETIPPYERQLMRKDGSIFWSEINPALVRDADGSPRYFQGIIRDISRRKAAEMAVQAGERRYQALIENFSRQTESELDAERNLLRTLVDTIPDYIYIKDTQLRFQMVNQSIQNFLRLPLDQIIGKTDIDIWGEEIGTPYVEVEQEMLRTGEPVLNIEQYTPNPHGTNGTWLETAKTPLRDADGRIIGLVGIGRDITRLKQTYETLRASEQRLALLVHHSPLAIIECDLNSRVLSWNPAAERIFGYSAAEAIGQDKHRLLLLPEDSALGTQVYEQIKQTGVSASVILNNITRAARIIRCEWHIAPLFDQAGTIVGGVSLVLDVTERLQADEALRQERDFIKAIFESTDAIIQVVDADMRIVMMNRAAELTSGYRLEDRLGKYFWEDILLPEDAKSASERITEAAASQLPTRGGSYWQTKQGERRWIDWTNTTLTDPQGKLIYIIGVGIDNTERRLLEQRNLELLIDNERALLMRGLLRNLAHDLRTPLSVMHTGIYLLRRYTDPAAIARRLDMLEEQVNILTGMLDQIFMMSDLDSAQDFPVKLVEVNTLIEEIMPVVQLLNKSERVRLHIELEKSPVAIWLNPLQFTLALTNILKNAVQHTPDGGAVTLRSRVGMTDYIIEVEDSGSGITPEDLPHIFERFYRADKARTLTHGQTGLGLAIARKIILMHSGQIEVESEMGKGSLFRIRLPLHIV